MIENKNVKIETRPLVRSNAVEAGEDYWIEEEELQKYNSRELALKNRKMMEGEISQEKLKGEIVAPYTQNWIGIISVGIIVLAVIVKEFPELLNAPLIPIPDLWILYSKVAMMIQWTQLPRRYHDDAWNRC